MNWTLDKVKGEFVRNIVWRIPNNRCDYDTHFRKLADYEMYTDVTFGGKALDIYKLQSLCMTPSDAKLNIWHEDDQSRIGIEAKNSDFIQKDNSLRVYIQRDNSGFYAYFENIMFDANAPKGFGAVAFFRAAQAASALNLSRIDLLAAGGKTYKTSFGAWPDSYNGYYSWPRFGFDADLHPTTKSLIANVPKLKNCNTLLELINLDPAWWHDHGGGGAMSFDLSKGSLSWHTLTTYLKSGGLLK